MIRRPSSTGPRAHRVAGPLLLLLSCLAPACYSSRDESNQTPQGPGACAASCHGDSTNAAPPADLDGNTDPQAPGVGAHRRHLEAGDTHVAFECSSCHVVPTTTEAAGHADTPRPAEVQFTGVATTGGITPTYDVTARTCKDSYCHGGPGTTAWPAQAVWNAPRASADACGTSCHSLPPGGGHPQSDACESCHADTAGAGHTIKNPALHINGNVEVAAQGCSGCHGSDANSAPPKDLSGSSDTTSLGVGAHQAHLAGGAFSKPVPCTTCHVVPADPGDPGHTDTASPAEVDFSGIADQGSSPAWDRTAASCSATYCHGSASLGGVNPAPLWTTVDGTQASCGSCHSLPPPAPHPDADTCEACHDQTVGPNLTIKDRSLHINGTVEVKGGSCNSCHGSSANDAPPVSIGGSSATTDVGVGAHQTHLAGGQFSRKVDCQECHVVPTAVDGTGHVDTALPAELTFSGVSVQDNASPSWDHGTVTCTGSYCHGGTLGGGSNIAPKWTTVDGSQATCGSCHTLPPAAPHVANDQCELCHDQTAGAGMTIIDRDLHVNGTVEVKPMTCSSCHGSATNDAPPQDLSGSSSTSDIGVGAHQAHLAGGVFSRPVECVECHIVPTSLGDPGHIDSSVPAELTFSGVAVTSGATPNWNHGTATCSNGYCHGSTLEGGTNTAPLWTTVDGSQAACGSCHALPPPPPHAANTACELCHTATAGPNQTIKDRTRHINGAVDIPMGPCNQCHGDATSYAPPQDSNGNTATTFPGVGAHRQHLDAAKMTVAKPFACDVCHPIPPLSSVHINGTSNLAFGGIADGTLPGADVTHASTPAYAGTPGFTCSQVYCHGDWTEAAHPSGGSNSTPQWNLVDGSQDSCGSCHSIPPPSPHPTSTQCQQCHPSVIDASKNFVDLSKHVNGLVDF